MSDKLQKRANSLFKEYPEQNRVFFTEDQQAFFSKNAAQAHQTEQGFKDEIQVFFREGTQREDTQDLQEAYEQAVEAAEAKDALLNQIEKATDLDNPVPQVEKDTNEVVTKVIQLREKYEETALENEALKKELEQLKTPVENGETQTDSKKK